MLKLQSELDLLTQESKSLAVSALLICKTRQPFLRLTKANNKGNSPLIFLFGLSMASKLNLMVFLKQLEANMLIKHKYFKKSVRKYWITHGKAIIAVFSHTVKLVLVNLTVWLDMVRTKESFLLHAIKFLKEWSSRKEVLIMRSTLLCYKFTMNKFKIWLSLSKTESKED